MYLISLTSNNTDFNEAKSLGFLTGMSVFYGRRFNKYEFRGTKTKHLKYLSLFKEFSKIKKEEIHDWSVKVHNYKEDYILLKK